MKILKLLLVSTILGTAVGIKEILPVKVPSDNWKYTHKSGLAYQVSRESKDFIEQLNQGIEYSKKFDEAIVFYTGGPKFDESWMRQNFLYSYIFGKSSYTKNSKKEKIAGNFNVDFDVYFGVQPQWSGIKMKYYFNEELSISNVKGVSDATTQRSPTLADVLFLNGEDRDAKSFAKIQLILEEQSEIMMDLAQDLKLLGYKKIHYIGHSYGSFILNELISRKGDETFKNIDSITTIATRLKASEKEKAAVNFDSFPYNVYDEKTKRYTRTLEMPVRRNAASTYTLLSLFQQLSIKDYSKSILALNSDNKRKYTSVITAFDYRVGSFTEEELMLKNKGINIIDVPSEVLIKYEKNYFTPEFDIDSNPKTTLNGKGLDHHDILLKWYLHNVLSKYYINDWKTKEEIVFAPETYWCTLKTDVKIEQCKLKY